MPIWEGTGIISEQAETDNYDSQQMEKTKLVTLVQ